jgi:hypothetical protein
MTDRPDPTPLAGYVVAEVVYCDHICRGRQVMLREHAELLRHSDLVLSVVILGPVFARLPEDPEGTADLMVGE